MPLLTRRAFAGGLIAAPAIIRPARAQSIGGGRTLSFALTPPPPSDIWASLDGRASAVSGAAQLPTLVNSYQPAGSRSRSGLSVVASVAGGNYQPPWQIAGVDYAVGPHSTPAKVVGVDPTPAGCSITGSGRGFTVDANNVTIDGWAFDGGGTESGGLLIQSGSVGTIVTNNSFTNGAGIDAIANSGSATLRYNSFDFIVITSTAGLNLLGNLSPNYIVEYNWFKQSYNAHLQYAGNPMASITHRYNLMVNCGGGSGSGSHAECIHTFGSGTPATIVQFNTIVQNNTSFKADTAVWATGDNGQGFSQLDTKYNTSVQIAGTGCPYHQLVNLQFDNCVVNIQENYADLSGVVFGWYSNNGDPGPYSGTVNNANNIAMKTVGTVTAGQSIGPTDHG